MTHPTAAMPDALTTPETLSSLGPVLDFMRLLWAVDHGLVGTSKRMEASIGVTGPQRLAIRIVGQFPAISPGALATILHLHPSTLTGVLRRLTTRGLMERAVDPLDHRRSMLKLTARGRRVDMLDRGTVEAGIGAALGRVSAADLAAAKRVLLEVAAALGSPHPGVRRARARRGSAAAGARRGRG